MQYSQSLKSSIEGVSATCVMEGVVRIALHVK
jgi:hypothetical protein